MRERKITITFTRYNRLFFNKYYKKQRNDYSLNIDKIMKSKIGDDIVCMNKMQAFLLNYEITRLLDKIVKDEKYTNIVYINENLSITAILNFIIFINKIYKDIEFDYTIIYDSDDEDIANNLIKTQENFTKKAVEI